MIQADFDLQEVHGRPVALMEAVVALAPNPWNLT